MIEGVGGAKPKPVQPTEMPKSPEITKAKETEKTEQVTNPNVDFQDTYETTAQASSTGSATGVNEVEAPEQPLSPAEVNEAYEAAEEVLSTEPPEEAANKMAEYLKAHNEQWQNEFMKHLMDYPDLAANILGAAGDPVPIHGEVSEENQQVIADAISNAYNAGAITKEDLHNMLDSPMDLPYNWTMVDGRLGGLGNIMAKTGNENLINDFVNECVNLSTSYDGPMDKGTAEIAYLDIAAKAASGNVNSAENFAQYLVDNDKLGLLDPKMIESFSGNYTDSLESLMKTLAQEQPPSAATQAIFDTMASKLDNSYQYDGIREALTDMFLANPEFYINKYCDKVSDIDSLKTFKNFLSNTMFSEHPYARQDELSKKIGEYFANGLEKLADTNINKYERDKLNDQLGNLMGLVQAAGMDAIKRAENETAAKEAFIKGMGNFLGNLAGLAGVEFKVLGIDLVGKTIDEATSLISSHLRNALNERKESIDKVVDDIYRSCLDYLENQLPNKIPPDDADDFLEEFMNHYQQIMSYYLQTHDI